MTDRRPAPARLAALALLLALGAGGGCGDEPAAPPGGRVRRAPASPPPSLVLVVVDTLRRDAVPPPDEPGAPGLMPRLAARAAGGVTMRQAVAPASWTLPSMTSLLTGLLPDRHGADSQDGRVRLPASVTTYAEVLRDDYGYQTAAFTSGAWMEKDENLQGFDHVDTIYAFTGHAPLVDAWLGERDPKRPFFLLLHAFDVHDPYGEANHAWPPSGDRLPDPDDLQRLADDPWGLTERYLLDRPFRTALLRPGGRPFQRKVQWCMNRGCAEAPDPEAIARIRAGYEGGVRWCDGLLDQALQHLADHGLLEHALLVVTSDHGEAFGEHGILGHARRLDDELVRIPMLLWGPPPFDRARTVDASVGLLDLLPTYVAWAGLEGPDGVDGRSFLEAVQDGGPGWPVLSHVRAVPSATQEDGEVVRYSVRTARWKVIASYDVLQGTILESAFDLRADPEERFDLTGGTGVLPAGLAFDPDFCRALEAMRDRLWSGSEEISRRAGTPYGAQVGAVRGGRPTPCEPSADR